MADTNFSRSGGSGATGWLIGGGLLLFVVFIVALAFSGGPAPTDGAPPAAIETAPVAPTAPVTPTE
ncbi:hypothetical protein [Pseudaestuariivita atlantica]|uniref:Uncharacterized protein n=1 Tax=Pseudaestuariivita atlantica TaxID=1317121 RepID=A0A0L1JUH8_9RHOB|nr:hypothetical protein [Pseudaestuariivita atlantica]KNG95352.1 hypothetical protein ATO11_01635 [Pseudaestuariivita atlantica]